MRPPAAMATGGSPNFNYEQNQERQLSAALKLFTSRRLSPAYVLTTQQSYGDRDTNNSGYNLITSSRSLYQP